MIRTRTRMESDRVLVEIAAYLRAPVMVDEDLGIGAMNQLRMCAAQMGATPAVRSKIALPDEPDENPADRFYNWSGHNLHRGSGGPRKIPGAGKMPGASRQREGGSKV